LICEKRLDNNLKTIEHNLQSCQDAISGVVVESTYNWYWLVDGLIEHGYPLHLAKPQVIQQYNGINSPPMRATWLTCCAVSCCW
jgi:transposase